MVDDARSRIGANLAAARDRAGFSQDEVGVLIGQPRTVISNWENDARRPGAHDLERLAMIYRTSVDELLGAGEAPRVDFEKLLFRDAGGRLDVRGKYELQRFLAFLDDYSDLAERMEETTGLKVSPFAMHEGFVTKEDMRRRAEEARSFFGIGEGPVRDLVGLADIKGISVYFAPLGPDLTKTVSGAFVPHLRAGLAVIINNQTTPGRRQFTLAHELGHALFQGSHHYVGYFGRREAAERFANAFASEFLVPTTALRARVESFGVSRVTEPEVAVFLQRYFSVSYEMLLVRLRAANLAGDDEIESLRKVRPVQFAEALGYTVEADERGQDPETWGLSRLPGRFLGLLRRALKESLISTSGAAAMAGVAAEDIEDFLTDQPPGREDQEEFEYIAASG